MKTELILGFIIILILLYIYYCIYQSNDIKKMKIKKHGNNKYSIYEIENILTSQECDTLIKYSKYKFFEKSTTYDNDNNKNITSTNRISKTAWFKNDENEIETKCSELALELTNREYENLEYLQIVHYPVGGYFIPHYDSMKTNTFNLINSREYTLLLYLNDVEEGGETIFPHLNVAIKPKKGNGVLFRTLDKNDNIIFESLHGSKPILKGEKWICNKWIHNKKIDNVLNQM
jgi:prolyl 4-hydroxylase